MQKIKIYRNIGNLSVICPYHPLFIKKARRIDGQFNQETLQWIFHTEDYDLVAKALVTVFGVSDSLLAQTQRVRITMKRTISISKAPIFLGGRLIARAFHRDSEVDNGDGIVFISGYASAGGSSKNWTTDLPVDTIFEIKEFYIDATDLLRADSDNYRLFDIDVIVENSEKECRKEQLSAIRGEIALLQELLLRQKC